MNLFLYCNNTAITGIDLLGKAFMDDLLDAAKVIAGIGTVMVGISLGGATSWTGAGAVVGMGIVAIGIDQTLSGMDTIVRRLRGESVSDATVVQRSLVAVSQTMTGRSGSDLEYYLSSSYSAMQLASTCYGGFVSFKLGIKALKFTRIPSHTEPILIKSDGFIKYTLELKASYWKIDGGGDAARNTIDIIINSSTLISSPDPVDRRLEPIDDVGIGE